jgi:hypothetical protein
MSGKLGSADLAAATNTEVYVCLTGTISTVNVSFCNRNALPSDIRLAITDTGLLSLTDADYLEYDLELVSSGILERTGIVLSEGQSVVAYSALAEVSTQVWGWEEVA